MGVEVGGGLGGGRAGAELRAVSCVEMFMFGVRGHGGAAVTDVASGTGGGDGKVECPARPLSLSLSRSARLSAFARRCSRM